MAGGLVLRARNDRIEYLFLRAGVFVWSNGFSPSAGRINEARRRAWRMFVR